ncbi:MAG: hypothetical protein AVDCRST_MAG39-1670 [uncultured Sphingomonadaceae bacterium]|uniref:YdbS-like PH domain-containing protein n=1 Tax=uncultured Sphingomonadaceae bacterium TaxID=169976 RepID=A0A6J4SUV3_9SPHN|nr:MAG: hypothetical protein AVDCRST_MAG39-1670 [uncultured Sphingomonadaceae bacterium]
MSGAAAAGSVVADRRVHPATVPLQVLTQAPQTVLGAPALFAFTSDVGWRSALGLAGGLFALVALLNWVAWRRFRYGVGAAELVIESGILSRNRRSIPFARVQDVDIEQGPVQRLFGLAKVRVETGGAGGDEGVLDSVSLAEAERLRAAVRAGRDADAPRAETRAAEHADEVLYALSVPRLIAAGLFNWSLIWIAALFGALQSAGRLLPDWVRDPAAWMGVTESARGRVTPATVAAVLLFAGLLGVVTGIVRTGLRDYGFRLVREGARLRRTRGLFTRTEIVIPRRRVQLAQLLTGPVRKRFDGRELFLQTLSSGEGGGGRQTVAPFATATEAVGILRAAGTLELPDEKRLQRVSSGHVVRVLLRSALPLTVGVLTAAWFYRPALFALALLPALAVGAWLERRYHRYLLDRELLFVARGWWRQALWVVPLAKVHSVALSRSWLQRRLGLASLLFDTAGAPALRGVVVLDLAEERARALAEAVRAYSGRKSGTDR